MRYVRGIFARKRSLGPGGARSVNGFRIVHADYTFHELSDWRDLAFDNVLGTVARVHSLDLDEANNRVTLGIEATGFDETRANVTRTLVGLGVDSAALRFTALRGAPQLDVGPPASLTSPTTGPLEVSVSGY